jgi:hypothetical protein
LSSNRQIASRATVPGTWRALPIASLLIFRAEPVARLLHSPDAARFGQTTREHFMSKKASEHHKKASEHLSEAARHHGEAAKHYEGGSHEKAAHHAHSAGGHADHARHHAEEARKAHVEEHGKK